MISDQSIQIVAERLLSGGKSSNVGTKYLGKRNDGLTEFILPEVNRTLLTNKKIRMTGATGGKAKKASKVDSNFRGF